MSYRAFLSLVLFVCCAGSPSAETVKFKATEGVQTYAVREPVLRLKPGDILESNTLFSTFFTEEDGPWPGEVGPIYIEGATPDDTLVIKIHKIHPNIDTGRSGTSTSYASLSATKNGAISMMWTGVTVISAIIIISLDVGLGGEI